MAPVQAEPTRPDWTADLAQVTTAGQYAIAAGAILAILAVGARRGLGVALLAFVLIVALGALRHGLGRLP